MVKSYFYSLATDKRKGKIAGSIKIVLFLFSYLYGVIIKVLFHWYRFNPFRLKCKVISVGNITLGGTGKTTLVELIARYLKSQGHKVAVLTRGYHRRRHLRGHLEYSASEILGDEPHMLHKHLKDIPIIVDADRKRGALRAIAEYGVDTVILDDGFQQWRLEKDLEIVTVDAETSFGNRHILPRGILREPLSALKRAHVFVLANINLCPETELLKEFLTQFNPSALVIETKYKPLGFSPLESNNGLLPVDTLKDNTVSLVSGIGKPDSFERLIESLGITIGLSFRYPDHHRYLQHDGENIIKESKKKGIKTIVTTEKDAAKLQAINLAGYGLTVLVLKIEIGIKSDEQRFYNRLLRVYTT